MCTSSVLKQTYSQRITWFSDFCKSEEFCRNCSLIIKHYMCMKISVENFRIPVAIPVNKNEYV